MTRTPSTSIVGPPRKTDTARSAERGQATAEYALVMLAAAALAGLLLSWVVGTDGISRLLNAVMDSIVGGVVEETLAVGPASV